MNYEEFEKAIETMQLCTKVSYADLRAQYLKLSKLYHPDMQNADAKKFEEVSKAYKLLKNYMDSYRFSFSKEEFQDQYPSILNMEDWLSSKS